MPRLKAIYVLGPSSSGKTTLCEALASELKVHPPQYIKEVARTVMRTHGFTRDDVDTYEMQYAIMHAQLEAEKHAESSLTEAKDSIQVPPIMLSDRSAIDPIVYSGTSAVEDAIDHRQKLLDDTVLRAVLPAYRNSLFVVLEPVMEWFSDDGVRSLQDPWRYNEVLFSTLAELGIPYLSIGKETIDLRERVEFVLNHLSE
ncbi:AAA domain-containing protein [Trametes meyenii]|nr:AAA domain-containing protein [Trametes meyenii]